MLIVGYCFGIRSERRLCEEVHLNLAYRWFCRLGLDGRRAGPLDLLEEPARPLPRQRSAAQLFETIVRRCMAEGLVGGEGFAVDASMIKADANRQRGVRKRRLAPEAASRAVESIWPCSTTPRSARDAGRSRSSSRPPIQPRAGPAPTAGSPSIAYSTNYLIDLKHAVIVDVEATTAVRQAEVTAAKTMIDRTPSASASGQRGWRPTRATARPRCWPGWSMSAGSSRTSRCSTNPSAPTAPSRATTSPTTRKATSISALPGSSCENIVALLCHAAA